MQISTGHIILVVIAITIIFLVAAGFLLLYVFLYNKRKKRHTEEKVKLKKDFEEELLRTQMEVQEQTLETIGREIHDNIGQLLSLTRVTLSTITLSSYSERDGKKISNSLDYLNTSIQQLRQLAAVLHADNILSTGLNDAIKREVERLSISDAYQIVWESEGIAKIKTDPKIEVIAFRIIQEVINNTIKHSQASVVKIHFLYTNEYTIISVDDNGRGFDVNKVLDKSTGLGMHTLFKRAKMIGGELEIESELNIGTKVTLKFLY